MYTFVIIILSLCAIGFVYTLIAMFRNELVYKWRIKAIDIQFNQVEYWKYELPEDYDNLVWNPLTWHIWAFKKAYPEFYELSQKGD